MDFPSSLKLMGWCHSCTTYIILHYKFQLLLRALAGELRFFIFPLLKYVERRKRGRYQDYLQHWWRLGGKEEKLTEQPQPQDMV